VVTERWAIPRIRAWCTSLDADALLFPGIKPSVLTEAHARACKAANVSEYWLHDARHSFAIRALLGGEPLWERFTLARPLACRDHRRHLHQLRPPRAEYSQAVDGRLRPGAVTRTCAATFQIAVAMPPCASTRRVRIACFPPHECARAKCARVRCDRRLEAGATCN
jgi:hypothetical protein